jgi:hypothetical protein
MRNTKIEPSPDSLMSKVELPTIIDLIVSKQNQYYSLWGVYTAVQFAAGSYQSSSSKRGTIAVFIGLAGRLYSCLSKP